MKSPAIRKPTGSLHDKAVIIANLSYYQHLFGAKKADIAKLIGIHPATLSGRLKDPEKFTLGELGRIARFYRTTIFDLMTQKDPGG